MFLLGLAFALGGICYAVGVSAIQYENHWIISVIAAGGIGLAVSMAFCGGQVDERSRWQRKSLSEGRRRVGK